MAEVRGSRALRDVLRPERTTAVGAVALVAAALVITFLLWPGGEVLPYAGVDASWGAALHLAATNGLDFGSHVLFTYGPLGFLDVPLLWRTGTGIAAIAFVFVQGAALVGGAAVALRPVAGPLLGLLVGAVLLVLCPTPLLPAVAAAGAFHLLLRPVLGRSATYAAVALGTTGALEAAIKLNSGALVLVVALLACVGHPDRRRLVPALLASAVVAFALIWVATGQSATALPTFLTGSLSIVSGYSEVMGSAGPTERWQYLLVLGALVVGVGAVLRLSAGRPAATRVMAALTWAVFVFFAFKAGFVRQDDGHVRVFTTIACIGLVLLPWQRRSRLLAVGVVVLALGVVAWVEQGVAPISVSGRPDHGWQAVRLLASPGARRDAADAGAFRVLIGADIDDALVRRAEPLDGVAVWPTESSLLAVEPLRFKPLPIFQDYQAYSVDLDRRDADALADAGSAPEGILVRDRPFDSIDGRPPAFNTPGTVREMLCRYVPDGVVGAWGLLRRTDDGCPDPSRPLGSVRARSGQPVPIPAPTRPDAFVTVAVDGVAVTGTERVRSFLLRARPRSLSLDGQPGRLTPGTAAVGAPVRAGAAVRTVPGLVTQAQSIAATNGTAQGTLTYRFAEQVVRR